MRSRAVLAGPTTLLAAASAARATGVEGLACYSYNYCSINAIGTSSSATFSQSLQSANSRRITLCSAMNGENHPIGRDGRDETIDQQQEEEEQEEKETESDRFGNLRVWNHSELVDYYEQIKQILLDDHDPKNDRNNENQTPNTAASFPLRILEPRHRKSMVRCVLNHPTATATKTMTKTTTKTKTTATKRISRAELRERLRLVEQRRRWKLTRKLLFGDYLDWNPDLDGNGNRNGNGNGNVNRDGDGASSRPIAHRYWWDNEAIAREAAPGFLRRLHGYRSELRAASSPTSSPLPSLSRNHSTATRTRTTTTRTTTTIRIPTEEEGKNPKKFLSRLASGRCYKGDFGVLLNDYYCLADATNSTNGSGSGSNVCGSSGSSSRESGVAGVCGGSLSLYEEIVKDKPSSSEDPAHELELLRCFIDELEEGSTGSDGDGDGDEAIAVDREQLVLLRAICDLDFDLSSSSSSQSQSPSPFALAAKGDGGRALGKRGERHLASYLSEKHSAIDVASASVDASALLCGNENENDGESENDSGGGRRPPWLLSPVWVRPRSKNRRNLKERCRCVLEIPTFSTGNYASSGTTSEYDAMIAVPVVDRPNERNTKNTNVNNTDNASVSVLAIAEVWEAKATLDPSSLLDVLEKKVLSLQSLLLDEESRVVQLSGATTEASIGGNPNRNHAINNTTAAAAAPGTNTTTTTTTVGNEGANFVLLLPRSVGAEEEDPSTPTNGSPGSSLSPRVFRVGLECPERTEASALGNNNNNDNDPNDNDDDFGDDPNVRDDETPADPSLRPGPPLPKIGIFASRMLGPRTGARRIKTVVGERLLETDLETVRSVLGVPGSDAGDDSNTNDSVVDSKDDNDDGNDDDDNDARRSSPGARTAGLVRDESVAMVERILRLVRAFRPEVVVGMLGE